MALSIGVDNLSVEKDIMCLSHINNHTAMIICLSLIYCGQNTDDRNDNARSIAVIYTHST